jgi:hypothetical protein
MPGGGFVQSVLEVIFGPAKRAACSHVTPPDTRLAPEVGHGKVAGIDSTKQPSQASQWASAATDFLVQCPTPPDKSSTTVSADDVSTMIRDAESDPPPLVSGVVPDSWGGPAVAFSADQIRETGILQ